MKKLLPIALSLLFGVVMAAPQLQFLNKLDVPLLYAVGTKSNPPANKGTMNVISPGKESKLAVADNPWILLYEQGKPENAFIYQFNTDGKSKLAIRIVKSGAGSKIEPQTTLGMKIGGNVTANDIIPVGSGSSIATGAKPQPKPILAIAPGGPSL